MVADAADGPRFLLTHVEDIEERKRRELHLAHRASHDSLTGLPNSAELRSRLSARLCRRPQLPEPSAVDSLDAAYGDRTGSSYDTNGHGFDFAGAAAAAAAGQQNGGSGPSGGIYDDYGFDHHVHIVAPEGRPTTARRAWRSSSATWTVSSRSTTGSGTTPETPF